MQGALDGRDLNQDIHAVAAVLDHLLKSAHLSFDAAQPPDEIALHRFIAVGVRMCIVQRTRSSP